MSDLNTVRERIKKGDDASALSYAGVAIYIAANLLGMGLLLFLMWPSMRGNYLESNPNQMLYLQVGLVIVGLVIGIPALNLYLQRKRHSDQLCIAIRDRNPDELLQLIQDEKSAAWVNRALEDPSSSQDRAFVRVVASNFKKKENCIQAVTERKTEVQNLINAADSQTVGVMSKKGTRIFWALFPVMILLMLAPNLASYILPLFFLAVIYIFIESGSKSYKMLKLVREIAEPMESTLLLYCSRAIHHNNRHILKQVLQKRAKNGDKDAEKALASFEA